MMTPKNHFQLHIHQHEFNYPSLSRSLTHNTNIQHQSSFSFDSFGSYPLELNVNVHVGVIGNFSISSLAISPSHPGYPISEFGWRYWPAIVGVIITCSRCFLHSLSPSLPPSLAT